LICFSFSKGFRFNCQETWRDGCKARRRVFCSEEKSPPTLLKSKSSLSAEDQKALYKRLEKYDDWTKADYEAHKKEEDGKSAKADGLLCFFSVPEDPNDWLEVVIRLEFSRH